MKKTFFFVITTILVVVLCEVAGFYAMSFFSPMGSFLTRTNPYFTIRKNLIGDIGKDLNLKYLSLPYLGYIPFPNYTKDGILQHNRDGYRGDRIPRNKSKKYRIICMGGSTTYGFGVNKPQNAYPNILKQDLDSFYRNKQDFKIKYGGVEVLNAGLEAGTSAEELQQYLFKYKYFQPDLIILHTGVNDALLASESSLDFQLDYTHYRNHNFNITPFPDKLKFLLKSYFFSFLFIKVCYLSLLEREKDPFTKDPGFLSFPKWSNVNIDSTVMVGNFENYPFYENINTLLTVISQTQTKIILLPNALNKSLNFNTSNVSSCNEVWTKYQKYNEINKNILITLSLDHPRSALVPFNYEDIDAKFWLDDCHLNEQGERAKAMLLLPEVVKKLIQKIHENK